MRELPILFSTPMVRAILDGNKTMTRRIVKPQPPDEAKTLCGPKTYEPIAIDKDGEMYPGSPIYGAYDENGEWGTKCPYQPGDHLWVRETFCEVPYEYNHIPIKGGYITVPKYAYKADSEKDYTGIWRPSIHMPKAVARIWLEVTNVRVERLQEITEDDARAEGVRDPYDYQAPEYYEQHHMKGLEINTAAFAGLWDSLNAKRGYGWDTNPWVWVIEFRKVKP